MNERWLLDVFCNKKYQTLARDQAWETNMMETIWRKPSFFHLSLLIEIFPAQDVTFVWYWQTKSVGVIWANPLWGRKKKSLKSCRNPWIFFFTSWDGVWIYISWGSIILVSVYFVMTWSLYSLFPPCRLDISEHTCI